MKVQLTSLLFYFMILFACGVPSTSLSPPEKTPTRPPQETPLNGFQIVAAAQALIEDNFYPRISCRALLDNAIHNLPQTETIKKSLPPSQQCNFEAVFDHLIRQTAFRDQNRTAWEMVRSMVIGLDRYSRFSPPNLGRDQNTKPEKTTAEEIRILRLSAKTYYLRIFTFEPTATETIFELLNEYEAKVGGLQLIIDLRQNNGGSLTTALEIANFFIDGKILAVLRGSHPNSNRTVRSRPLPKKFLKIPIILIIDSRTGSAAEVFTAIIQSHRRGKIVGERSFGKGAVQANIPMFNGSVLRFTVAHVLTPLHKPIEGVGIIPDIPVLHKGTPWTVHIPPKSKEWRRDPFVLKAVQALKNS